MKYILYSTAAVFFFLVGAFITFVYNLGIIVYVIWNFRIPTKKWIIKYNEIKEDDGGVCPTLLHGVMRIFKWINSDYAADKVSCISREELDLVLACFRFEIKKGSAQHYGSGADIYAECKDEENGLHFMIIDDGNVTLKDAVIHIYAYSIEGKIFEGKCESDAELRTVLKTLGFLEILHNKVESEIESIQK